MKIDVSKLFSKCSTAIICCKTKQESNLLCDAIEEYYHVPKSEMSTWRHCWNVVDNCHRFEYQNGVVYDHGYCYREYYEDWFSRLSILDFYDLQCDVEDLGEISSTMCSAEQIISALF